MVIYEEICFRVIIFFLTSPIFYQKCNKFLEKKEAEILTDQVDISVISGHLAKSGHLVKFLQDRLLNFQLLNSKNTTLTEGNSPVYRAHNHAKNTNFE